MTRLPPSLTARIRAAHDAKRERSFVPTPAQKLAWLGSATLRAPARGHTDVVQLGRRAVSP